jgi:hypothetical protein
VVITFDVSNRVIAPAPDWPAISRDQVSSTPQASGVTIPRPVTTTLRILHPVWFLQHRQGDTRAGRSAQHKGM